MQLRSVSGMNIPQCHRPVPITIGALVSYPHALRPAALIDFNTAHCSSPILYITCTHHHATRLSSERLSTLPLRPRLLIKTLEFEHRRPMYLYNSLRCVCGTLSILDAGGHLCSRCSGLANCWRRTDTDVVDYNSVLPTRRQSSERTPTRKRDAAATATAAVKQNSTLRRDDVRPFTRACFQPPRQDQSTITVGLVVEKTFIAAAAAVVSWIFDASTQSWWLNDRDAANAPSQIYDLSLSNGFWKSTNFRASYYTDDNSRHLAVLSV